MSGKTLMVRGSVHGMRHERISDMDSTKRLLFVDDEPQILSALKRVFRREAYEIATAADGPSGLETFRQFRPSVIVSDLRMPGMTGVEFLSRLRAIDPEPVRVVLTGCTDLPAAEAAINQGEAWRFLTKPWNDEELRVTIACGADRFRLVAENRTLTDKLASIGLLAGGVAHELNNPLAGVLAYAQILQNETDPGGSLAADLRCIEDAALRAKRIVADLLDFARTSHVSERRHVTLAEVAERAIALARFQLRDVPVQIESSESPTVFVDANRLQQVVLNLLSNAFDAISQVRADEAGAPTGRGRVCLRTWQEGGKAFLSVSDDGPGIPADTRDHIFDAFFTTKPRGKGTGLGLAVSQSIVRDHGGRLELVSAPGEGATFVFSIPAPARSAVGADASQAIHS